MSESGSSGEKDRPKKQVKINVPDDARHGTYANFLVVSHSPHEFTLDFCQIMQGGEADETKAEVVSRVRVAPTLVGKIISALNTNMTNYEERFGQIDVRG